MTLLASSHQMDGDNETQLKPQEIANTKLQEMSQQSVSQENQSEQDSTSHGNAIKDTTKDQPNMTTSAQNETVQTPDTTDQVLPFRGVIDSLSNFYPIPGGIEDNNITHPTVEHAYHAQR